MDDPTKFTDGIKLYCIYIYTYIHTGTGKGLPIQDT